MKTIDKAAVTVINAFSKVGRKMKLSVAGLMLSVKLSTAYDFDFGVFDAVNKAIKFNNTELATTASGTTLARLEGIRYLDNGVVKVGDVEILELTNPATNQKAAGWRKVNEGSLDWINNVIGDLPVGSKTKIKEWISKGVDNVKLKSAFNNTGDKLALFNKLNSSKGLYHQRAIINDYLKIPGVIQAPFVSNSVDNVTSNVVKSLDNKQFIMNPNQAKTFAKNATLSSRGSIEIIENLENGIKFIKIKPGTKLYRVFDGYKPWDNISMTGNTLPNGSFWTFEKPTEISEVISGTAVMPEWNGMTKVIEIEVPSTGLYGWYGKAAKQPASSSTNSFLLEGGYEQIIINFSENQQNVYSITKSITNSTWTN